MRAQEELRAVFYFRSPKKIGNGRHRNERMGQARKKNEARNAGIGPGNTMCWRSGIHSRSGWAGLSGAAGAEAIWPRRTPLTGPGPS